MWLLRSKISKNDSIFNSEKWDKEKIIKEEKEKEKEITILTYNIDCDNNSSLIGEAIVLSNADIVCLQENHDYRQRQLNEFPDIVSRYPFQYWFPPKVFIF